MVTNLVYGSGIFKVGLVQMAAISVDDEGMLEAEDGISNPDLEMNQLTDYSDFNLEEEIPEALSRKEPDMPLERECKTVQQCYSREYHKCSTHWNHGGCGGNHNGMTWCWTHYLFGWRYCYPDTCHAVCA